MIIYFYISLLREKERNFIEFVITK